MAQKVIKVGNYEMSVLSDDAVRVQVFGTCGEGVRVFTPQACATLVERLELVSEFGGWETWLEGEDHERRVYAVQITPDGRLLADEKITDTPRGEGKWPSFRRSLLARAKWS